mmetsp:Transcript_13190/g.38309  ORF Transcript_13190/g.38309 Transcript_13190/m.38309 type:complete len:379 (-) Transcript_13190:449-1585(-)
MGSFKGGDYPFHLAQSFEALKSVFVGAGHVGGPPRVLEEGMLRAYSGIVESRGDGARSRGLAFLGLKHIGLGSLKHAGGAEGKGSRVQRVESLASCLHAHKLNFFIIDEGMEGPNGVAATADACDDDVRERPKLVEALTAGLLADDGLEVADDRGKGVRADGRANEVMSRFDVGHPVAKGLVDRVLEGPAAALHWHHLGTQGPHAEDVELLALAVDGTHVDDAVQPEHGADRGSGDPVLSSAGFSDNPLLTETLGQQSLADGVVNLMGASVRQVLALEPDRRSTEVFRQALGLVHRRGTTNEFPPVILYLLHKARVGDGFLVRRLQLLVGFGQGLRDVLATIVPEVALLHGSTGSGFKAVGQRCLTNGLAPGGCRLFG